MNTGEQLREMQRAFAYPLEDRIKQLEARNAALVASLSEAKAIIVECSTTLHIPFPLATFERIDAALQQEATHAGIPQA